VSIHEHDSFTEELKRERVFHEFEQAIREANTSCISRVTGGIGKEHFLKAAIAVARLRADYLNAVLCLADGNRCADESANELKRRREAYEEALLGFGALRHALKRGYFELSP